jgi:biopolymer transport protein ExbB
MEHSAAQARRRLAVFLIGFLIVLTLVHFSGSPLLSTARAQDEKAEKKDDEKKDDKAAAAKKDSGGDNLFWHIVKSAGVVFGPLLLVVSILLVWLIVLLAMDLRLSAAIPPAFVEDFTDIVNKRRFKEAYELAKEDSSFLARVMTTGMARLQYGIEDAREAAANMVESVKASKEQLITYLATIGTLGPLLGLVGTVFAMILAFMKLKVGGSEIHKQLADDISHGLVVTMLGVGLAVPAIFAHAFFRNRLIRLAMDTQNMADDLLTQMYHNSKKGAGPAPGPQPTMPAVAAVEPVPAVAPIPADNRAPSQAVRPK